MNSSELLRIKKIIQKKLLGKRLTYKEVYEVMDAIAKNKLDDILLTYFVAATYRQKNTTKEIYYLTKAMVETGTILKFTPPVADKHSTGGVPGNRVTMVLVPIIASLGIKIPKTSSRAITTPAGTADCMEVLAPVDIPIEKVKKIIEKANGCIIWGGHLNIAPADDKLIRVEKALQFESEDKIIVSIMAKKISVSASHLVLDIPYDKNLKIKSKKQAQKIAKKFKEIARFFNITVKTIINHSPAPIQNGIGPALESLDVLKVLERQPDRPRKLEEKALFFAAELLKLVEKTPLQVAKQKVQKALESGLAHEKFKEIIKLQGGNPDITAKKLKEKIEKNTFSLTIKAASSGKIKKVNLANLSSITKLLGAPTFKWAGIFLYKQLGDTVEKGEPVLKLYAKNELSLKDAVKTMESFPIYEIQ